MPRQLRADADRAGLRAKVLLRIGDWKSLGEAAASVRSEVFVREQAVPAELEWDDQDALSIHCVAFAAGEPVATGRLLRDGQIGRMAVLADWRRAGLGGLILERLVDLARERGDPVARLNAQLYVEAFYLRHGFIVEGEAFDDAGIPHIGMRRSLR